MPFGNGGNRSSTGRKNIIRCTVNDVAGGGIFLLYKSRNNGATADGVSHRRICIVFSNMLNMLKYGNDDRMHNVSGNLGFTSYRGLSILLDCNILRQNPNVLSPFSFVNTKVNSSALFIL
jgi:hypothetical protein